MAARVDFRTMRGHVEALAGALGLRVELSAGESPGPAWPAGRTSLIRVDGVRVGAMAELAPADLKRWDLQQAACVSEIDLPPWIEKGALQRTYREFSRLPEVRRDLAVVVEEGVTWDRIVAAVRAASPAWMEHLEAFDVYRGAQVPAGRKSVAFAMSFRREDRTLTREEVDGAIGAIVGRLGSDLGASLRA
jgi:phenylalanyl-tRNA synthetase beta chain